jgi:hypothetical protein
MRALIALGQLFVLNMIYLCSLIFSLGLLVGPATSALFCLTTKIIQKSYDPGQVVHQFFRLVKQKIRYSLYLEMMTLVLIYICSINLGNVLILNYPVFLQRAIIVVQYIVLIEISLLFVVASYLHGNFIFQKFSDLLKMGFYLIHRHLVTTITLVTTVALLVYFIIFYLNATLFLLLFSLLALWVSLLYIPICKRYIIRKEENHESNLWEKEI